MKYFLTFYVDTLPDNSAGVANGPIIRILKSHKDDIGLHKHEMVHVKQWLRTFMIHPFFYKFSKQYRLDSEVEAYREQLKYYKDDRSIQFAGFIADDYDLDIKKEDVVLLLRKL